jgi:hypothetical protein
MTPAVSPSPSAAPSKAVEAERELQGPADLPATHSPFQHVPDEFRLQFGLTHSPPLHRYHGDARQQQSAHHRHQADQFSRIESR